ncbi:hypothetical protein PybrP1_002617 [[Pythium] brassicae (nom. inval.)]|nr:hypothetical protein PybrP1_002617 [[Pythium] brassicae (nom. inval.)]
MPSTAAAHARRFLRLTPRSRLGVDVLFVLLMLALDARDVWFKVRWLGSRDANAFVAVTHHEMQEAPLEPAHSLAFSGQKHQRASGWSSFLQKCEALHPFTDVVGADARATFSHAMGKNCEVGLPENSHRVPELVMSSSVRVDSVAWAACHLLQDDRKPAICHSSVVRLFTERYNMAPAPSLLQFKHHSNLSASVVDVSEMRSDLAAPGSDAEAELTDLLGVISTSSPLSSVVCVEAFAPRGPGRYTASIFGCGNPSYYKSAFVGLYATAFPFFQQDKARLARDTLHILGMTFVTRENSRSLFALRSGANGLFELRHKALLNFSSFGALYTIMLTVDVLLLALNACSVVEIGRLVLGRPQLLSLNGQQLYATGGGANSLRSHNYKLGVLSAGLHRSKLVMTLTLLARLLSWMVILPSVSIWDATELQTGRMHAWLTAVRGWVLVLLAVNALWDICVALGESQALAFVRTTHVRVSEVAVVAALAAYANRGSVFAIVEMKRQLEMQRLSDARSFRDLTAQANAFSGQLDFLQNTPSHVLRLVFAPLGGIVAWGIVGVAALALVRSWYYRAVHRDLLSDHESSLAPAKPKKKHKRGSKASVLPDASESSPTKPLLSDDGTRGVHFATLSPSPPPSPMHASGGGLALSLREVDASDELRLPLEQFIGIPVRARSLVRSVWFMEKRAGQHVALHPALPLEHGVVQEGNSGCMRTRCGFLDVVHPFLSAREHAAVAAAVGDQRTSGCEQMPLR